jgi:hypothetical protein
VQSLASLAVKSLSQTQGNYCLQLYVSTNVADPLSFFPALNLDAIQYFRVRIHALPELRNRSLRIIYEFFFYSANFIFNVFSIRRFLLFDLWSHSTFFPFDVLSHSAVFPFDVLSHSAFCLSTFCRSTFRTFCVFYFDILSVNHIKSYYCRALAKFSFAIFFRVVKFLTKFDVSRK